MLNQVLSESTSELWYAWELIQVRAAASVPETLTTLLILAAAFVVYRLGRRGLRYLTRHTHLDDDLVVVLLRIHRTLVVVLTLLAVCQVWGVLHNLWAALTAVVTLVAIGFVAVWSVLSNVLCSLILMATRPFRAGDRLTFPPDAIAGRVRRVNLTHTLLIGEDGSEFQVPNNLFFQRIIQRSPRGMRRGGQVKPPAPGLPPPSAAPAKPASATGDPVNDLSDGATGA